MSKHKHRHDRPNQNPNGETPEVDETMNALASSLGGDEAAPDENEAEEVPTTPDEETTVTEPAAEQIPDAPTPPPEPPKVEPEPPTPPTPAAKTVDLEKTPVAAPVCMVAPTTRRVASKVLTKTVDAINAETSDDPHRHTSIGRKLIAMFDEYAALCKKVDADPKNQSLNAAAAMKLYDIMTICCPRNGNQNAGVYAEMIKIVFKKLSQGYGTIYKDSTLLRMDYRLPTPVDSMKFDAFYSAMWQLVEAAKTGSRITYNTTTLSRILNSPSAMVPITQIRRRLESVG